MASYVKNVCTKNYQNLIIGFQVTVKDVGDVFWDTVYILGFIDWLILHYVPKTSPTFLVVT